MYVVAARSTCKGPPGLSSEGRWQTTPSVLPVGVRHALPRLPGAHGHQFALCGATLTDWVIMVSTSFQPQQPASCHRCGQLVMSAGRRQQIALDKAADRQTTPLNQIRDDSAAIPKPAAINPTLG